MNILKTRNNVISYTVNKEISSNCYVAVDGGEVVVNAPWYFSRKQIQTIIEEKRQWILNKIEEYQEQNRVYSDKGSIVILGSAHQVRLYYKSQNAPSINIVNRTIEVVLPNKYKKLETTQILKILVDKLYEKVAEQEVERAMEKTRLLLGYAPEDYEIKKLANKTHRENPKNKFLILGLTKQYKVVDYKVNLSQSIWRINEALSKMTTSQEIIAYMWTEDGVTIDANKINIFNLDAEDEIKKAIEKSEDNKINLYKIKLGKGSNVIAFSNCIYYDNQNKTLPVGMDNDTRIIAKLSDMNIELDSKKVIKVGKLDDEEMGTKLIVKNINILEYTVKQMEEE